MTQSPASVLRHPRPGAGRVPRARLVSRLASVRDSPLVLLVAPAGYGKTTLISEWEAQDRRRFARVSAREVDNDPGALLDSLTAAFDGAEHDDGVVVVIDDAHHLSAPEPLALLAELIERQRPGRQLVLASRVEPPLRLGRLRARRRLVELRAADLAMTVSEAAALMQAHGLALDRDVLEALVQRTEGWPAALYLAALAARDDPQPRHAISAFGGHDRFVADYLDDELLSDLSPEKLDFLSRLSVLDHLSGPVCDFVLDRSGSARLLKALSRTNVMLIPLDRSDTSYRFHRLFAEALRAELARVDPALEAALHLRASAWYEAHGDLEPAIEHAIAAGDPRLAGDLLWPRTASMLGFGQTGKVDDWLTRFSDEQIGCWPTLALAAAASSLVAGDRGGVERWTAAAQRQMRDEGFAEERRALDGQVALIRAAVCEDRVARIGKRAELASKAVPEGSAWRALDHLLRGVAHHLLGEREQAQQRLEEGARHAAADSPWLQSLCLAQLALLAIERGDWIAADCLAARAKAQVERSGIADYPTVALVYAVSAEVQAHTGHIDASKAASRDATRLLTSLVDFSAWYEAECRLALARAALRLSDVSQARVHIAEADRQLQRASDAEVAAEWLERCKAQAGRSPVACAGDVWCLTTAELRILQFLPTHVSMKEIADLLYVSRNTVKTHARSVYRKLGASSRGDAVVRARRAGLLDEPAHAT